MVITITTSGGIGGFGLARSAEVELADLPAPLREEACSRLAPDRLGALAEPHPGAADSVVYHIVVEEAGRRVAVDVDETTLPAETLDLIDALMARSAGRTP